VWEVNVNGKVVRDPSTDSVYAYQQDEYVTAAPPEYAVDYGMQESMMMPEMHDPNIVYGMLPTTMAVPHHIAAPYHQGYIPPPPYTM
jgi:hypothetical protein